MSNLPEYKCSSCKKYVGRERLTVKKATFMSMGEGGKTLRSRVVGWICDICLTEDPQYNAPRRRALAKEKV